MEHHHGAAALAACVALLAAPAPAQPPDAARSTPAAGDTDRLRILHAELDRAEHEAAAAQSDVQRHRAQQDVAALHREIAGVERRPEAASAVPRATPPRSPAWWDIYARHPQPPALPAPIATP